jgi:hypothetical protein
LSPAGLAPNRPPAPAVVAAGAAVVAAVVEVVAAGWEVAVVPNSAPAGLAVEAAAA